VIGLNLCPFARAPFIQQRIRFAVSPARDAQALLDDLRRELRTLHAADPLACQATLLIHPHVLGDFLDFNDFLDVADAAVRDLAVDGELQVASFHPDYRFADAAADAVENCTNRSPYPTLHLLRESSIEAAVESGIDTDAIYQRNIETLQKLGDAVGARSGKMSSRASERTRCAGCFTMQGKRLGFVVRWSRDRFVCNTGRKAGHDTARTNPSVQPQRRTP
jgi:hypothetical protein